MCSESDLSVGWGLGKQTLLLLRKSRKILQAEYIMFIAKLAKQYMYGL